MHYQFSVVCPHCNTLFKKNIFYLILKCDNCGEWLYIKQIIGFPVFYLELNNRGDDILVKSRQFIQRDIKDRDKLFKMKISTPEVIYLPFLFFQGKNVGFKISSPLTDEGKSVIFEKRVQGAFYLSKKVVLGEKEIELEFDVDILTEPDETFHITPVSPESSQNIKINIPHIKPVEIWDRITMKMREKAKDEYGNEMTHSMIVERRAVLFLFPLWIVSLEYKDLKYNLVIRDSDTAVIKSSLPMKSKKRGRLILFSGISGLLLGYIIRCFFSRSYVLSGFLIAGFVISIYFTIVSIFRYWRDVRSG